MSTAPEAPGAKTRAQRPAGALPAAGAGFFLLAAFHPSVASPYFTPKATVTLVLGAIGLPLLVWLAVARDGAARAAVATVAWSAVAAAVAGSALAWTGQFSLGTGAVFVACVAGAWGLGRVVPDSLLPYAAGGLVAGAALNALLGVLQGPFDLSRYTIFLVDQRSAGLMGNPVFLGAVSAGAAWSSAARRLGATCARG
jgi:hypothetical protein